MSPRNRSNTNNEGGYEDSLPGIIEYVFDGVEIGTAIAASPFENVTRHNIGSRYKHVVIMALEPIIPLGLMAISLASTITGQGKGLVGMGIVYTGLAAFMWKHYWHVFMMIAHMEREELSREDGESWSLFKMLPRGDEWPMCRFVYEPGLLISAAAVLTPLHVITPLVGGYLVFGAVMLFLRAAFIWFHAWQQLRDILDEFNLSKRIAANRMDAGSDEAIRNHIKASLQRVPASVPREVFNTVLEQAKPALPKELQSLIDEAKK